ncbi:4-hydroxy-3-methylbut-2-enyl diphosphate reductase [Candidatus Ruminimicrobiellum ovillum]|uniref:4-hydroxy-3-methylbut-2-enyl diphosphate reductase n=1 Tax=Candidatus Ruminimicrobiellum ovillum TaxID=1947927 RepID=UPI003559C4B8
MVKITIAKSAGFCFGVKRAIDLAQDIASKNSDVYTFGPLIHNPQEVARLEKENIKVIEDYSKIEKGVLVLRTHGIPLDIYENLSKKENIKIVDAACPFVKKAQDIIKELSKDSEQIVIVGEKKHPEVVALVSYGKGKCLVVEDKNDVKNVKKTDIIYIVSQTTQSPKKFEEIVNEISKISQVKVFNTICRATFDRQSAAAKLAKEVDVMIVIGGKNSGNTTRLYQICSNITKTYHIEDVDEIEPAWFDKVEAVGITAGASTPDWIIENIKRRIKEITNC